MNLNVLLFTGEAAAVLNVDPMLATTFFATPAVAPITPIHDALDQKSIWIQVPFEVLVHSVGKRVGMTRSLNALPPVSPRSRSK